MSTPGVKQDPEPGTPAAPAAAPAVAVAANMSAGIPVQTYSSPAHAQWAAASQQMVIDPALQQQSATSTAPKPAATTTASQQAAATAAYYQAYQHYPQHYAYQYITQTAAHHQQQQQQHSAAAHTPTTLTSRATFSVATTPATPTPVTAHSPATVAPTTPATTSYNTTTSYGNSAANTTAAAASSSLDTSDVATLNDALGSAGVDLRAEEESLQRHDPYIPSHMQTSSSIYLTNRQYEDRSRKQALKPAFNTTDLSSKMRPIGTEYKVTRIPEDSVNYMALALRARLQDLITAMIDAGRYRKEAQFDRPASMYERGGGESGAEQLPMWSIMVRSDVAKQLAVLERVEREEELWIRRERKERQELAAQHTANLAAQANGGGAMVGVEGAGSPGMMGMGMGGGDDDGQPKKKKKKDGPGVTARNLSEDVRKKMSNAVATQAAGLGKYSWMTASPAATPSAKKVAPATPAAGTGSASSSWARPYVPKKPQAEKTTTAATTATNVDEDPSKVTVTMRDAVFVLEKERGHGAGRGSARGWK